MMGRELARALDLEPEEILETAKISSPEERIYDQILLQDVVKETRFRCKLVQVIFPSFSSSLGSRLDGDKVL